MDNKEVCFTEIKFTNDGRKAKCASGHILIFLSSISFSLYSPQLFNNRKDINGDQSLPFYVDDFYFQFHICFGGWYVIAFGMLL